MFTVLLGGYNTYFPDTFYNTQTEGISHYLMLHVKADVFFRLEDNCFTVNPGNVILIPPCTPYEYYREEGGYSDDWLSFDCNNTDYFASRKISLKTPIMLQNPDMISGYIKQILMEEYYTDNAYRADNIDMLFRILINNIVSSEKDSSREHFSSPYFFELQNLRLTMQSEPRKRYHPEEIAQSFGISISYFQHLYTRYFKRSFQADLINMRIEHAMTLLRNLDLTIDEVLDASGYMNKVHFYRQFKHATGMTPSDYRTRYNRTF